MGKSVAKDEQTGKGKIIMQYVGDPKYFVGVVVGGARLDHLGSDDKQIIEIDTGCDPFILRVKAEGTQNNDPKIGRMYSKRG